MPTDANGVYSLPPAYLATDGTTIHASQHNPPLEDIATSMTARLPRNGSAPMSGALRLTDGTSAAPSLALASNTTSGFYKSGSGLAAVNVLGMVPVGTMIDYGGFSLPTGWLYCAGQSLLRASYPDLYAAIGTLFGSVDSLHFSLPDCRSVVTVGKGDMVFGDRGILTGSTVMGALLGAQSVTLDATMIPAHSHTVNFNSGTDSPDHVHPGGFSGPPSTTGQFAGPIGPNNGWGGAPTVPNTGGASVRHTHLINGATDNGTGGGLSHANVQPTIVVVKLIYAGV